MVGVALGEFRNVDDEDATDANDDAMKDAMDARDDAKEASCHSKDGSLNRENLWLLIHHAKDDAKEDASMDPDIACPISPLSQVSLVWI